MLIASTVFVCSPLLPFMQGLTTHERTVVACVCAIVLSTLSPTVTLAIIEENGAAGPICETLLGVVAMADLAIIFSFAGVDALASSTFDVAGSPGGMEVMIEVLGRSPPAPSSASCSACTCARSRSASRRSCSRCASSAPRPERACTSTSADRRSGRGAGASVLGAVMLDERFGPVVFRGALMRSGEAGKRAGVA